MERRGEDLEDRLLEFAARVRKVIYAMPDTRLARHIVGQVNRYRESQSTRGTIIANDIPLHCLHFAFCSSHFNFFNKARRFQSQTAFNESSHSTQPPLPYWRASGHTPTGRNVFFQQHARDTNYVEALSSRVTD